MSQNLPQSPRSIPSSSKNEHEKKAQKSVPNHRTDAQAHYGQGKKLIGHGKSWLVRGRLLRG
jgi:hypothetical protein